MKTKVLFIGMVLVLVLMFGCTQQVENQNFGEDMDCYGEGESVPLNPSALDCCEGLVYQPPESDAPGAAGTCVAE